MSNRLVTEGLNALREAYNTKGSQERLDEGLFGRMFNKGGRLSKQADTLLNKFYWPMLSKSLRQFDDVLDLNSVKIKQTDTPRNQVLRGQDYMFVIDAKPDALQDYSYSGRTHKGLIDQKAPANIQRALNQAVRQWEATPAGKDLKDFVSKPRVNFSYAGNGKYQTFNIQFTIGEFDFDLT